MTALGCWEGTTRVRAGGPISGEGTKQEGAGAGRGGAGAGHGDVLPPRGLLIYQHREKQRSGASNAQRPRCH